MYFEVKKQEATQFMNMICLANYIIQYGSDTAGEGKKYNQLAKRFRESFMEQIIQEQKKEGKTLTAEETRAQRIWRESGFSIDELPTDCEKYVEHYERETLPYALAQYFAQKDFPVVPEDEKSEEKNYMAQEIYSEALTDAGIEIVGMDFSSLKTRVDAAWKHWCAEEI